VPYLENKLGTGDHRVDAVWGVAIMILESEKVSLLRTRENGHVAGRG